MFSEIYERVFINLHNDTAFVREMGDVSDPIGYRTDYGQVRILIFLLTHKVCFFFLADFQAIIFLRD